MALPFFRVTPQLPSWASPLQLTVPLSLRPRLGGTALGTALMLSVHLGGPNKRKRGTPRIFTILGRKCPTWRTARSAHCDPRTPPTLANSLSAQEPASSSATFRRPALSRELRSAMPSRAALRHWPTGAFPLYCAFKGSICHQRGCASPNTCG